MTGWRWLGVFWAAVVVAAGAGAVTLQVLGAPGTPATVAAVGAAPAVGVAENAHGDAAGHAAPVAPVAPAEASHDKQATAAVVPLEAVAAGPAAAHSVGPLPETGGAKADTAEGAGGHVTPIAMPVAALMEVSRQFAPAQVPRVGSDGRLSRIVYAAPAPRATPGVARVAVLCSGFGLAERESRSAIADLPGAVSFAVSSYATGAAPLLRAAREAGHELLASVPMEPRSYPGSDEGSRSLLTGAAPGENATNLEWALSRTPGIVGATGASDGMRGERFADISALFDPMVDAVTARGLLYVDARPGRTALRGMPVRAIDVVLDDQLGRAEIDARLQSLERTAQERGSAIGLVGTLRPMTIERIAAWSKTLEGRGMVLVPVSAVVNP